MMIGSVLSGISAAAIVCSILYLQGQLPSHFGATALLAFVIPLTLVAAAVQWLWLDRSRLPKTYSGAADMLVQIHSPSTPDSPSRWAWLGAISWCLAWITGSTGAEGAASEWEYASSATTRSRSVRWLEQRRRTDAARALSAGVGAAFGAPFSAVLIPLELGMGGRTLSTVVAALVAALGVRLGCMVLGIRWMDIAGTLDGVDFTSLRMALTLAVFAVLAGVFSAIFLGFNQLSRRMLAGMAPQAVWIRMICAGLFLFWVGVAHPLASLPSHTLLQDFLVTRIPASEAGLLFVCRWLSLTLILVGFGSVGVFWPIFALGGLFGFATSHLALVPLMQTGQGFFSELTMGAPLIALVGAATFWAGILNLPISAGVLVFELTGDIRVGMICLGAALIAQRVARLLAQPLLDQDLEATGLKIVEGRVLGVMEGLFVRDAMVTDQETIFEKESIPSLAQRLLASKYPFLPVVRSDGTFTGMVTTDMVQERLGAAQMAPEISALFEVKDLLFHSRIKMNEVQIDARLSQTQGLFDDIPCAPVLSEDGRVLGLLFVHHVRLAYEREIARRSLVGAVAPVEVSD